MIRSHRLMFIGVVIAAAFLLVSPASAELIRPVVSMTYLGASGGAIHIIIGGNEEYVSVGPYAFNVSGTIEHVMFCDSASYNLETPFSYVQLSGADVLNGSALTPYGRLYSLVDASTAKDTYELMSWAFQHASTQSTDQLKYEWYRAAQIYMWELWADTASPTTDTSFNLAAGDFQVALADRKDALVADVMWLNNNAKTNVIQSLYVPVRSPNSTHPALYQDASGHLYGNSDSSQEFLVDPSTPVPEPGTLLLLGSGLAGFALWVRRHRG
jgi:hypothetical protein